MIRRLKSFESYQFDTSTISSNNAEVRDLKKEDLFLFGHFTERAPISDELGVVTLVHFKSVSAYRIPLRLLFFHKNTTINQIRDVACGKEAWVSKPSEVKPDKGDDVPNFDDELVAVVVIKV